MSRLEVFDPPMCCETGICGADVDPVLPRFAADLAWLASRGVDVCRFNAARDLESFRSRPPVLAALEQDGNDCLPLILVNGQVVSRGAYPDRVRLADLAGLTADAPRITPAVEELIAIGASIAANCEPCFKAHFERARDLDVPVEDIEHAVRVAQAVKEAPARTMLALAERFARVAKAREGGQGIHPVPAREAPTEPCCCGGTPVQTKEPGKCC